MNKPLSIRVNFRLLLLPVLLAALLYPAVIQANGQAAAGDLRTVRASAPAAVDEVISDDFNTCGIDETLWTTIYTPGACSATIPPDEPFSGNSRLHIYVPGGSKHSITEGNTDAPRVEQEVADTDFVVQAKFEITQENPPDEYAFDKKYQMQGILIDGVTSGEYIRFEFFHDGANVRIYAGILAGGVLKKKHSHTSSGPGPGEAYYVRVERSGDDWTHSYSYEQPLPDGSNMIREAPFSYPMEVEKVGVYAGNDDSNDGSDSPPYKALVDYFFNVYSPIEDEDGARNELNVTIVPEGMGHSVDKNPPKTSYACEEVTLTANAAEGWSFAGWAGDIEGISDWLVSPATVFMSGSRDITANFALGEYTLTVNTVGSGVVEKDPDQAFYEYGTEVELTAIPAAGHILSGWSGDLTGDDNPTTISMTQDRTVTATFIEGTYTLNVATLGGGTVTVVPDKPGGYDHGDVVTLTAFPATGWSFAGWTGDRPGAENPTTFDMTQNTDITANFVQEGLAFNVFLPLVVRDR